MFENLHNKTQTGKIFIGGLSLQSTEESIRNYFENHFGEVHHCLIMRDKITGKTRGFGYVTFKDSLVIENILRSQNVIIDGKRVECKIAIPKDHLNQNTLTDLIEMINEGNINKINNARLNVEKQKVIYPNKIFVGGLPLSINEDELFHYFLKFGPIEECSIMCDKNTGTPRGFGFIIFKNPMSVEQVMKMKNSHCIRGKWIDCKPATPKEYMDQVISNNSSDFWKNSVNSSSKSNFFQSMLTEKSININNTGNNEVNSGKNKKKKNDNKQIKAEDEVNGMINFPMQNHTPIAPANADNSHMCFDTGFYFNNVPNNIHFNNLYKQEEPINSHKLNLNQNELSYADEFANNFNFNHRNENFEKQKSTDNTPKSFGKSSKRKRNLNNNNNGNSNVYKNEYPTINPIYSVSQPTMVPVMGIPFGFNPNPQFFNNPIYPNSNINNGNQFNPFLPNQIPNAIIFPNNKISQNSFNPSELQNFNNPINNKNFAVNQLNNSFNNNYSGEVNGLSNLQNNIPQKLKKNVSNNINPEYFYPQKQRNNSDEVIDKTEFLNEFADFNNHSNGKSKENNFEPLGNNIISSSKDRKKSDNNLASDKNSKNVNCKQTNPKGPIKPNEETEVINFSNFKEILVENDIANKEGNLLAFSKKLSTLEEKKDGKSLIQNNYQVTIINGFNLNDNAENKKNFNLDQKLLNRLQQDKKLDMEDITAKIDSLAIKSSNNKNRDFLNYLGNPEPTAVKQSEEEGFKNAENSNQLKSSKSIKKENDSNNNNPNNAKENEFYDFNKIMKKNSNNKTPNITSDYYAYKFTSGGESLKLDLNFDKEFYQSTRQNNKQRVELFIPIDEDDFKNKIENNSKRQEEKEIRHTFKVIKGGCGSGSLINISQNENLNESFDKEFGDSYGPKKKILKINREDRIFKPY